MRNLFITIFTLFFAFGAIATEISTENNTDEPTFEDGNLISEPLLADYIQATRAPGILVEPYDIQEIDESN